MLILMPDVEALTVTALNQGFATRMPGVTWATKIPNPKPEKFGRIILAGGVEETIVTDQANLLVEGWAEKEADAVAICALARSILLSLDGELFGGLTVALPANLPDPTTSHTRYTCTVGIRVRATITA